jgi:N-acetylmuramic acid 6-phosphate etherase
MVNVHVKNSKLMERAIGVLEKAAAVDRERAMATLQEAGNSVPVALIMLKAGVSKADAQRHLDLAGGNVRRAFESAQPISARRSSRK